MDEKRNIDRLFADAAQSFVPQAPAAAWDRLEASLAARRRKKRLFWWFFSTSIVVAFGILLAFFYPNSSPSNSNLKASTSNNQTVIFSQPSSKSSQSDSIAKNNTTIDNKSQIEKIESEASPVIAKKSTSKKTYSLFEFHIQF